MRRIVPLILALALTGCAGAAATAIEDSKALHEAARAYVREVHDARREIRQKCRELLIVEVNEMVAEGRSEEAREKLKANYPALVTVDVITKALDEPGSLSREPFGCD